MKTSRQGWTAVSNVPENLIAEARRLTGAKTRVDAVVLALERFVEAKRSPR